MLLDSLFFIDHLFTLNAASALFSHYSFCYFSANIRSSSIQFRSVIFYSLHA